MAFCHGRAFVLRRAPIAAVARSMRPYPPCNKMYKNENYRRGRPVIGCLSCEAEAKS